MAENKPKIITPTSVSTAADGRRIECYGTPSYEAVAKRLFRFCEKQLEKEARTAEANDCR